MQPNRNIKSTNHASRNAAPLSSAAYFDASTKSRFAARIIAGARRGFRSWVALKLSNRVKRGEAAQKQWRVDVHADMIKITRPRVLTGLPQDNKPRGGLRGEVTGFSRESRKRMFEFMAQIRNTGGMLFLTLTYDDAAWLQKSEAHQDDFEAFRRRFERAFPTWRAIWRVEIQQRKSGMLRSMHVPHFHMIVFTGEGADDYTQAINTARLSDWGNAAWHEITASTDENHRLYGFHVTPVRNRRHAYSYVSKYVGKRDDDGISCGRRWGRIGKFDRSASERVALDDAEITALRRLVKRWLKNRNSRYARRFARQSCKTGFTAFGIGDTGTSGEVDIFTSASHQFIYEAKRQVRDKRERERAFGD